jgi:hypothetical protein
MIAASYFVWNKTTALARFIWKPFYIAWTLISRWIRITWSRLTGLARDIWEQIRIPVKAIRIWLNRIWEITKSKVKVIWRRLWRTTGFWKGVAENLRHSQAHLIRSISTIKASIGKRMHDSRQQMTTAMRRLRENVREVVRELRLWVTELRDQTAELLRSIVPHG